MMQVHREALPLSMTTTTCWCSKSVDTGSLGTFLLVLLLQLSTMFFCRSNHLLLATERQVAARKAGETFACCGVRKTPT